MLQLGARLVIATGLGEGLRQRRVGLRVRRWEVRLVRVFHRLSRQRVCLVVRPPVGRNSSAQMMYITKSGTNGLHGELYDYLQNDKLNARPFFDRTGKTNVVRQNSYGYSLGGPVYLPNLLDNLIGP